MTDENAGPDLSRGVQAQEARRRGQVVGHVGDTAVMLAWVDGTPVAVSAACTHAGGPLARGLRVGDTVRCPWHHACFSLRTGAALETPALKALDAWRVEREGDLLRVRERLPEAAPPPPASSADVRRIVVVGGGAAGFAAIARLRALGYGGELVLVGDETRAPYDRTKLSKAYLAGKAGLGDLPLEADAFYAAHGVGLKLGRKAEELDATARRLTLAGGEKLDYDTLLLATGAEPKRLDRPGFGRPEAHLLRSLADSDALIAAAENSRSAAVVGSSFIALEAAGSLRQRGLEVALAAPDDLPLAKMGPQLGAFVKALHEENGVSFHLGREVERLESGVLRLDDGTALPADLVVVGAGVSPRLELARSAGLRTEEGVCVDAYMRTSADGVFAAGDIAAYPDPLTGRSIRVEHWAVAERQGQVAAVNMLGGRTALAEPPFFWSAHYGVSIRYVGHAERWDTVEVEGDLLAKDAEVRYIQDGQLRAVATVGRDMAALTAAERMRQQALARASKSA